MKLNPGDMICEECNGKGKVLDSFFDEEIYINCNKCNGEGKLDWIENIVGKEIITHSALDNVNVRKLMAYIKQSVENIGRQFIDKHYNSSNVLFHQIGEMLEELKARSCLNDYEHIMRSPNQFSITIQPRLSAEYINLEVCVK